MVVVLPETTAQVSAILKYCSEHNVKVVPRGAGTSLSGGALPLDDGVLLGMARIQPYPRGRLRQPGRRGAAGRDQSRDHARGRGQGFYYAPDPSSQIACSIGGNVAENSGGVHCLKYGLTTNNVLGVEMVLIERRGDPARRPPARIQRGLDLLGLVVGSEGLLGVVTEVIVRILPKPELARALLVGFPSYRERRASAVADVIAAGIIPAGMEMMDRPAIHAAEAFVDVGYPLDVEALLIVELDGTDGRMRSSDRAGRGHRAGQRRDEPAVSISEDGASRDVGGAQGGVPGGGPHLARTTTAWTARFRGASCRDVLQDAWRSFRSSTGLGVANVFHAGDGNLHPLVLYDANKPGRAGARGGIRQRISCGCVSRSAAS